MNINIKIIQWNCKGIERNLPNIMQQLGCENNIFLLQETLLQLRKKYKIPEYTVIRKDRTNAWGRGVAILVSKSLQVINQETFATDKIEGVSTEIAGTPKNINIINSYSAKGKVKDEVIQEIKQTKTIHNDCWGLQLSLWNLGRKYKWPEGENYNGIHRREWTNKLQW